MTRAPGPVERLLDALRAETDARLAALVSARRGPPPRLKRAVGYALSGPGKRVRPALCLMACEACGVPRRQAMPAALALEMVHTYSLVHDDLPAMDDDDLRRGRPTVHRAFDEATAVLAGDALLTLAFETLAASDLQAPRRAALVLELARAAGWAGMVGGQALDLEAEGRRLALPGLLGIHRRKTGALLMASVRMGGLAAGAPPRRMDALTAYGRAVGLAFQIQDDILDVTGSEAKMGKRLRKDAGAGKATFPVLLGLARSRARAQALAAEAVRALAPLGRRAEPLALLARFIVSRER